MDATLVGHFPSRTFLGLGVGGGGGGGVIPYKPTSCHQLSPVLLLSLLCCN